MDDTTILGSTLGQLGQTAKQAVKQVIKIPQELAQDVGGQVGGAKPIEQKPQESKQEWKSDEERIKFLEKMFSSLLLYPNTFQALSKDRHLHKDEDNTSQDPYYLCLESVPKVLCSLSLERDMT